MNTPKYLKKFSAIIEKPFKKLTFPIINLILRNEKLNHKLKPNSIKKILILRHDVMGDMIVTLPMFRYLKEINPDFHIDVYCTKSNFFVIEKDPQINKLFIKKDKWYKNLSLYIEMKKQNYDLIINSVFSRVTIMGIISNYIANKNTYIIMHDSGKKYEPLCNKLISIPENKSKMMEIMVYIASEIFETNISNDNYQPYIFIDDNSKKIATNYLRENELSDFICINLSSRRALNTWTKEAYKELIIKIINNNPNQNIVFFYVDQDSDLADDLKNEFIYYKNLHFYPKTKNILEVAAVLSKSKLTISPDTGFIHLANAVNTPIVCMFSGLQQSSKTWVPHKVPHILIEAEQGKWVNTISADIVFESTIKLLSEIDEINSKQQ